MLQGPEKWMKALSERCDHFPWAKVDTRKETTERLLINNWASKRDSTRPNVITFLSFYVSQTALMAAVGEVASSRGSSPEPESLFFDERRRVTTKTLQKMTCHYYIRSEPKLFPKVLSRLHSNDRKWETSQRHLKAATWKYRDFCSIVWVRTLPQMRTSKNYVNNRTLDWQEENTGHTFFFLKTFSIFFMQACWCHEWAAIYSKESSGSTTYPTLSSPRTKHAAPRKKTQPLQVATVLE